MTSPEALHFAEAAQSVRRLSAERQAEAYADDAMLNMVRFRDALIGDGLFDAAGQVTEALDLMEAACRERFER